MNQTGDNLHHLLLLRHHLCMTQKKKVEEPTQGRIFLQRNSSQGTIRWKRNLVGIPLGDSALCCWQPHASLRRTDRRRLLNGALFPVEKYRPTTQQVGEDGEPIPQQLVSCRKKTMSRVTSFERFVSCSIVSCLFISADD